MDIKEIQNLIKFVQKSGVEEVKIERDDFKITIKTKSVSPQHIIVEDVPTPVSIPSSQPITQADQEANKQEISEPVNLENDNQVIELLDDISKDLFNHDLELRIQELESKFSKDLSETTFNELKELKNERKTN